MAVLESCAQLCANHCVEGERATLIGLTEDRLPPCFGGGGGAPEPQGVGSPKESVLLYFQEKQEGNWEGKKNKQNRSPLLLVNWSTLSE